MRTQNRGKEQLLHQIDMISFAVYDMLLYLDTHPDDEKALDYFRENEKMRRELLREYSSQYGPLTIDSMDLQNTCDWDWITQPWPWESCSATKGGNR